MSISPIKHVDFRNHLYAFTFGEPANFVYCVGIQNPTEESITALIQELPETITINPIFLRGAIGNITPSDQLSFFGLGTCSWDAKIRPWGISATSVPLAYNTLRKLSPEICEEYINRFPDQFFRLVFGMSKSLALILMENDMTLKQKEIDVIALAKEKCAKEQNDAITPMSYNFLENLYLTKNQYNPVVRIHHSVFADTIARLYDLELSFSMDEVSSTNEIYLRMDGNSLEFVGDDSEFDSKTYKKHIPLGEMECLHYHPSLFKFLFGETPDEYRERYRQMQTPLDPPDNRIDSRSFLKNIADALMEDTAIVASSISAAPELTMEPVPSETSQNDAIPEIDLKNKIDAIQSKPRGIRPKDHDLSITTVSIPSPTTNMFITEDPISSVDISENEPYPELLWYDTAIHRLVYIVPKIPELIAAISGNCTNFVETEVNPNAYVVIDKNNVRLGLGVVEITDTDPRQTARFQRIAHDVFDQKKFSWTDIYWSEKHKAIVYATDCRKGNSVHMALTLQFDGSYDGYLLLTYDAKGVFEIVHQQPTAVFYPHDGYIKLVTKWAESSAVCL